MTGEAASLDRDFREWRLRHSRLPRDTHRPDFLIISPAKTGTTWLADNLRNHPQLFIPAIKEVKFFSSYFKWLDLAWYLDHFAPAGDRLTGEASPTYALLPVERIRFLQLLNPDLKLIFLMREPVARAWSHARHCCRFQEANFAEHDGQIKAAGEDQWRANFAHDWTTGSGDYLGQLRRWLSVFPREQVYLGFLETIYSEPGKLLREVFSFLDVDSSIELASFPVHSKINEGLPGHLPPALRESVASLLLPRTRELIDFLRQHCGLEPPIQWQMMLDRCEKMSPAQPDAFRRELDDSWLARVVSLEETFLSARRWIGVYRGHDLYFRQRVILARKQPGEGEIVDPEQVRYFSGQSVAEVKRQIDQELRGHRWYGTVIRALCGVG